MMKQMAPRLPFNALIFLLFFAVQITLNFSRGAFTSEFGGHHDEAAHYITGLMVRDYVASLNLSTPMKFAEDYYLHYPQVAIGHWPPIFYVVQAAWTLPFSPSRGSVILLMSLLTVLLAWAVYLVIRNQFDTELGIFAGLLLIALPLIQSYSGMVMAEVLVALLVFVAVVCFGRFLETGKSREATGFGIFATLAILTKLTALSLVLVPPLALLFGRRFHLLARVAFWYPAVMVLMLCGPWYWLTLDMARNGLVEGTPSLKYIAAAIPYYSWSVIEIVGVGLFCIAAIGFFARVVRPCADQGARGTWASVGALLVGTWLLPCVIPSGLDERYAITAAPPLVMFVVAGLVWGADRLPLHWRGTPGRSAVAAAVAVVFLIETFELPTKPRSGLAGVAQDLVSAQGLRDSVFLVSSDSPHDNVEGVLISEIAMHEKRPGHIVLRASKVLANSDWLGKGYKLLYSTPAEMMKYLEAVPVDVVVIDSTPRSVTVRHHALLQETLLAYPDRWEPLGAYPRIKDGVEYSDAFRLYRLRGHETKGPAQIVVDMSRMLGRPIVGR
jgi:4-amino-4-deoxy-L-arabinose transferase-like glycosyltransferase